MKTPPTTAVGHWACRLAPMVAVLVASSACATLADPAAPLDRQLEGIVALLPGLYAGSMPGDFGAEAGEGSRIFHKIVRIDAPQFGSDLVFYHQISRDGFDSTKPLQQKIYAFDRDRKRTANVMRSRVFFPGQGYANLEQDGAALSSFDPATLMQFPTECAIRWSAGDSVGQFVARVSRADCRYQSQTFKQTIAPELTYILSAAEFAMEDVLYGENGAPLFPATGMSHAARVR